jgi:autotransporter-associated beta strand protein
MPDRRADLCRLGQKMFGTRYYYAATHGIGGRRLRAALLASSALALAWTLPAKPAHAQDATWRTSPISVLYGDGSNWNTGSVPSGTAYFGTSNLTYVSIGSNATVGGWTFNAGASDYLIHNEAGSALTFTGAGITVNGGSLYLTTATGSTTTFQNSSSAGTATSNNQGLMVFANSSTAGNATLGNGSTLSFRDTSTAGNAAITNSLSMGFAGSSTAGNAVITNDNMLSFNDTSTAGSASITNNGWRLAFYDHSTAGSATITNNSGGTLYFYDNSTTGDATIINNAGGLVYFSGTGPAGDGKLSVKSLTGAGTSYLDFIELTLGANNQSSELSGTVTGTGSLVKAGTGTLTLSGGNSYVGGTTITGGTLQLGTAANTGSIIGLVNVRAGTTLSLINSDGNGMAVTAEAGGTVDFSNSAGPAGDYKQTVGSIAGAGSYLLGANELTVGSKNLSTEVSGVISGTGGSLVKIGAGTLTLSAANTYTGGTTVNDGTLQLGTLARTGSVVGAISVGAAGTLSIVNTGVISSISNAGFTSYSNGMSAGSTAITNSGTLEFADTTTAGSAQITSTGAVNFRNASSAGNATLTINGGTANFYDTSSASNAAIANSGTLVFRNNSTAASATINNSGTLRFGDYSVGENSTAASATINNSGTLVFTGYSTAASATINNSGSLSFGYASTAGNATITNTSANAFTQFSGAGPAGNGVLSVGSIAGAGTFLVNGAKLQVGGNNLSTVVSGTISIYGVLEKVGTGTLTLTGAVTPYLSHYTDGIIMISGGTLQLGDASTTATFNGYWIDVGSGATLDVVNAYPLNIYYLTNAGSTIFRNSTFVSPDPSSNFSGSSIANTGTLSFLDTSTANTAFIDNNGTLTFSDHSSAGLATINNYVGSTLSFNGSSSAGSAIITNDGSLAFNNGATAGSAQITNNGTTNFANTSTAGNASITLNGGSVNFYDNSTAGSAMINVSNGSLIFKGNSTAGNAAISNNQVTSFDDGSSAGNAAITNNNQLLFTTSSTAGNAGIINNHQLTFDSNATAGSANITNNSQLTFNDSATAGNATITNNNQLTFDTNATAGSVVIINVGHTLFSGNATPGNAQLFNASVNSVFDLSMTSGPNGDNRLTAGSLAGSGTFQLGGKELTVGSNNLSTTVTGVLADGGSGGYTGASLMKVGTGTLTLAGINTYTGATTVDGGTLAVNGSILSSSGVTVNAGGTLGGNGIVGNTLINGGTLSPGNSIGLLTVQGSLVFTAAASYMVELSPSDADRVNVAGAATLGGATVRARFAPASYIDKKYTILNAASGVNGTFGSFVIDNLPSNFGASLSYDAHNAYLDLVLQFAIPGGLAGNPKNVGNALTNYFNTNGTIPVLYALLSAPALSQAAGETATGSQQTTFNAMTQFMGVMTDPYGAGRETNASGAQSFAAAGEGPSGNARVREAYATMANFAPRYQMFEPGWNVWAGGFGGSQTTDGSTASGSHGATSRLFGTAAGADYWFSAHTLAGFALAGGGTNFSVVNGGTGRSDLFQAGAFVRHHNGPAYLSAALAYGWQDVTADRTVTIAGIDRLQARFQANTFAGRVEGGYRFATPWMGITPYAAGQVTSFQLPAYAESALSGANTFALSYGAKTVTASRSELGLRTDKSWAVNDAILTLRGRAAWAHDFNPDRAAAATFQTLPGASFVVNGAAQAKDAALATASAEMKWRNGFSLGATFEGEFSNVTRSYAGKGVVRYVW